LSLDSLGSLAEAQGDLAGALRYFTDDLAIAKRLAASDPANATWQRDLSLSLYSLGSLAEAQGDLAGALRYFTDDLAIAERLAASEPANAKWQEDLANTHLHLGRLARRQGRFGDAGQHKTAVLKIAKRLRERGADTVWSGKMLDKEQKAMKVAGIGCGALGLVFVVCWWILGFLKATAVVAGVIFLLHVWARLRLKLKRRRP